MSLDNTKKEKRGWKALGGLAGFLVLFGGKLKFLLPLLKMGKFGTTIWTMILSVGAYMLIYPWSIALGIVIMLLIHELGHVWAAKRRGLPVSLPAFIPFFGAAVMMKKLPQDAATEAYIAIYGPFIGGLGAAAALAAGVATGYEPLYAIAFIGFFLNLLNLLPIYPLDGGKIAAAISRWLWVAGLIGGLILIIYFQSFLLLFFWGLFAWELYSSYRRKKKEAAMRKLAMAMPVSPFTAQYIVWSVPVRLFDEQGAFIPAAEHSRRLPFCHVGDIHSQKDLLTLFYPGLDHEETFPFADGLVHDAHLVQTRVENDTVHLGIKLSVERYEPLPQEVHLIRDEPYYDVPARTRWIYGTAYVALAAILAVGMVYTSTFMDHIR